MAMLPIAMLALLAAAPARANDFDVPSLLSKDEPPRYEFAVQINGHSGTVVVSCSRWKNTFGTPVQVRVKDDLGDDAALTSGEFSRGLPAEKARPYAIEKDGLRSAGALYRFDSREGQAKLVEFLAAQDEAMMFTLGYVYGTPMIPRFFHTMAEIEAQLTRLAVETRKDVDQLIRSGRGGPNAPSYYEILGLLPPKGQSVARHGDAIQPAAADANDQRQEDYYMLQRLIGQVAVIQDKLGL